MASTGAFTGDEHFFRKMALFLTVVTIAGFGYNIGAGKVSLSGLPGVVFVHAAIFMAWIVLLIVQPTLIGRNNLLLHRRLGWAGIVLSVLIVWLGWEVTIDLMLRQPESRNGVVLAIQMLPIVCFAILVFFGIILRKRSDWHRRLMLCATITLTAPAWARLLPGWLFGPFFLYAISGVLILTMLAGVVHDRRRHRAFHPAYWFAIALLVVGTGLLIPVGLSEPLTNYAKGLEAG